LREDAVLTYINESGKKCSLKESQIFIVDGCKVKINFLPPNEPTRKEDVLKCIQKTLLAASFSK
jgi:hypothetical protein